MSSQPSAYSCQPSISVLRAIGFPCDGAESGELRLLQKSGSGQQDLMTRIGIMRAGRPHHNRTRPFVARASCPRRDHGPRNPQNWFGNGAGHSLMILRSAPPQPVGRISKQHHKWVPGTVFLRIPALRSQEDAAPSPEWIGATDHNLTTHGTGARSDDSDGLNARSSESSDLAPPPLASIG